MLKLIVGVLLLVTAMVTGSVEKGPLLLSEVPAEKVYQQSDIETLKDLTLSQLKQRKQQSGLVREFLLFQTVLSLDPENVSADDLKVLETAKGHQPQAYRVHEEGPVVVPIYNIQGIAQKKLAEVEAFKTAATMKSVLQSSPSLFVQKSLSNTTFNQAAKLVLQREQALTNTHLKELVSEYQKDSSAFSVEILFHLSKLTGDNEAIEAVLFAKGSHWQKHQLLSNLEQYLSLQQLETLLRKLALEKSELSSQALIHYAQLPSSYINRDLLFAMLSDKELGASSATALAHYFKRQPDFHSLVSVVKQNEQSRVVVANSLLALRLSHDPEALRHIQGLIEGDHIKFNDIKEEVASWIN